MRAEPLDVLLEQAPESAAVSDRETIIIRRRHDIADGKVGFSFLIKEHSPWKRRSAPSKNAI
jgi:hypothetical protein